MNPNRNQNNSQNNHYWRKSRLPPIQIPRNGNFEQNGRQSQVPNGANQILPNSLSNPGEVMFVENRNFIQQERTSHPAIRKENFNQNLFRQSPLKTPHSQQVKKSSFSSSGRGLVSEVGFNFNYGTHTGFEEIGYKEEIHQVRPDYSSSIGKSDTNKNHNLKSFDKQKKEMGLLGKRGYDVSVNYDTESGLGRPIGDKSFKDLSHFGTHINENTVQSQIPKEFSGDLYGYIKQCIKRANQELEQEKSKGTEIAKLDMGHLALFKGHRALSKKQEDQDGQEKTVKLKIDFEPMGEYVTQNQYPKLKKEVLDAVEKISQKYSGKVNLEIQIKDLIPQSQINNDENRKITEKKWSEECIKIEGSEIKSEMVGQVSVAERIIGRSKDESFEILREELYNILKNSFDKKVKFFKMI